MHQYFGLELTSQVPLLARLQANFGAIRCGSIWAQIGKRADAGIFIEFNNSHHSQEQRAQAFRKGNWT
jgi:hypothetical protein